MLIEDLLNELERPVESIHTFCEHIIERIEEDFILRGESEEAKINRNILRYNYGNLALAKQILAVLNKYQRQVNDNYVYLRKTEY